MANMAIENVEKEYVDRLASLDIVARKTVVLETITQHLKKSKLKDYSLGTGHVGHVLFFFEIYKRFERSNDLKHAKDQLEYILDGTSTLQSFDLYQGIAGVGWLLNHLKKLDSSSKLQLAPDCCAEVDEILADVVGAPNWLYHYDLISGLVGIGVYAISHPDSTIGAQLFSKVIDRLIETSESDKNGVTWRSQNRLLPSADERARSPDGNFNLGIAHGIPGVISLLGKGIIKGYDISRCMPLLRRGISWLFANTNCSTAPSAISSFGYTVGDGVQARLAWCYGDLSVAIALFYAARALSDKSLFDTAFGIAKATLKRDMNISGVQDASLCHGSQGNAHIYRRLFQWTKFKQFSEACSRWESVTVSPSMLFPESSGGMFLPFKFLDEWKQYNGYLMGLSGIGLSLADGIYGLSNSWDMPMMTEH